MIDVFIAGVPPTITQQSKGVRCVPDRGAMRPMFYKKKSYRDAEKFYLEALPSGVPFAGPVVVEIELTWPWRKAESKKEKISGWKFKTTKPDLDNSAKLILDAMEMKQVGFSHDAQVAKLNIVKKWGDNPGTHIKVWSLEEAGRDDAVQGG